MEKIIQVENLVHQFKAVRALDNLTYSVEEGEVFGVLGPNGAGKTTSVRVLNGVLSPASGFVRVLGLNPVNQGCELRKQTGVLTETPSLYERLTARENLNIFGALYGVSSERLEAKVSSVLDQFNLLERASEKVGSFSKGMKQRLALARALIHDPRLLFLDEPTSGLDPQAVHQVTELIEQLSHQKGRTVFLCTHNLDEAQRLCDRVAVLNKGRLLAVGTQAELAQTLWHGQWVDIQVEAGVSTEFGNELCKQPGITNVKIEEKNLAIQVDSLTYVPDIIANLVTHHVRIQRVNPRQHTLEDIYFEIQGNVQLEGKSL